MVKARGLDEACSSTPPARTVCGRQSPRNFVIGLSQDSRTSEPSEGTLPALPCSSGRMLRRKVWALTDVIWISQFWPIALGDNFADAGFPGSISAVDAATICFRIWRRFQRSCMMVAQVLSANRGHLRAALSRRTNTPFRKGRRILGRLPRRNYHKNRAQSKRLLRSAL